MLAHTTVGSSEVARRLPIQLPVSPAPGPGAALGVQTALLGLLPMGVLLVDPGQRPIFVNPAARAILEADDGIGLAGGVLRESGGRTFESRLQRVLRGWCGPEGDGLAPFFVQRRSGRRPYEVTIRVAQLPDTVSSHPGGHHAVVYVRDPDAGVPIDEQALRQRFGLTPAEARTAAALALGGTLPEHSELRKLRPMTLRRYVKQVFARTGTHSQLDLVRLVLTGVAAITGSSR